VKPETGCFLVAAPQLTDPNFHRTVVFLLEHGAGGSMGLIVNRPLDMALSEIWEGVPACLAEASIAADGGPVERDRGILLHGCVDLPGAQVVGAGLAVGGAIPAIADRFPTGAGILGPRLFLGHSGWGTGQLAGEVAQGAWLVRPGRLDQLLSAPPEDLWRRLTDEPPAPGAGPSLN
jgi:putative transcriptional regulator